MSEVIKVDRVRKQITFKERVSFGKQKVSKAKLLSEINYSRFDKDLTGYINLKGHTYVYENVPQEFEDDLIMTLERTEIDEDVQARVLKGMSEQQLIERQEILDEYFN